MSRRIILVGIALACTVAVFAGCNSKSNPVAPPADPLAPPTGFTSIFKEGFESAADTSLWEQQFAAWGAMDLYPPMRFTTAAAHSGTHSLTTDSNATASQHVIEPRFDTLEGNTIVGVQFYIMAKSAGGINFTCMIGKNAGSSAGLNKAFGIGFDSTNVLKTVYYDDQSTFGNYDSLLTGIPVQPNKWYKCRVEVNLNPYDNGPNKGINFYVDDVKVRWVATPNQAFPGMDRLLVFRGLAGQEGPKQYYADDIVLYKK